MGFMRHRSIYMIFVENVIPEPFNNSFIFRINSIIALDLKKLKRQKDLSKSLSEYYSKGFYFSYDVDLTYSENLPRFYKQSTSPTKRLNWIHFFNRNLILNVFNKKDT